MKLRTASIIGGIGRTLIAFGLITLSFAAFQLWGTGLQEARAQNSLEQNFEAKLAELEEQTSALGLEGTPTTTTTTVPPAEQVSASESDADDPVVTAPAGPPMTVDPLLAKLLEVEGGAVLGNIAIPSIGLDRHVVEGVERSHLRDGPGHYPTSPRPGQTGNAAIAGHRTTYGEPFADLDLLNPGDEIVVTTLQGVFRYQVMAHETEDGAQIGHFIVQPDQVEILDDFGDNRLTLTACHPKFSARQRIVVTALLVEEPAPLTPTTVAEPDTSGADEAEIAAEQFENELELDEGNVVGVDADVLDESLGWNTSERTPTIVWGLITAITAAIAVVLSKLWKPRLSYAVATPGFLLSLFICFTHLDRFLPAL